MFICAPGVLLNLDEVAAINVTKSDDGSPEAMVVLKCGREIVCYRGDAIESIQQAIKGMATMPHPSVDVPVVSGFRLLPE